MSEQFRGDESERDTELKSGLPDLPLDETDEDSPFETDDNEYAEENETRSERDLAIEAILLKYGEHPRVHKEIGRFKTKEIPVNINLNDVQRYYNFAAQFPLLDKVQEQDIFRVIEAGILVYESTPDPEHLLSEEEEALIDLTIAHRKMQFANLRLVADLARPFASRNLPLIDLLQEGNIALSQAIGKFDYTLENKFSTFATKKIRGALRRAAANQGRIIRMPVHAHDDWLKISRHTKALLLELEREPTELEIAESTGLPLEKVQLYRETGPVEIPSLDKPVVDSGELTLGDVVEGRQEGVDEEAINKAFITKVLASPRLSDREKLILGLYYNLLEFLPEKLEVKDAAGNAINYKQLRIPKELTWSAIAQIFGLTRERVIQLRAIALNKARFIIENLED